MALSMLVDEVFDNIGCPERRHEHVKTLQEQLLDDCKDLPVFKYQYSPPDLINDSFQKSPAITCHSVGDFCLPHDKLSQNQLSNSPEPSSDNNNQELSQSQSLLMEQIQRQSLNLSNKNKNDTQSNVSKIDDNNTLRDDCNEVEQNRSGSQQSFDEIVVGLEEKKSKRQIEYSDEIRQHMENLKKRCIDEFSSSSDEEYGSMIESFTCLETGQQQSRSSPIPIQKQESIDNNDLSMDKIIQENSKNTYRWEAKKQNFDDMFADLVVEDCELTSPELVSQQEMAKVALGRQETKKKDKIQELVYEDEEELP